MSKRVVKNYPSPRLMETIGATNQKPAEAIGELVANSFDARIKEDKLEIRVDMRDGKITVLDNGKGMTDDILERAVCIAEDMSQYIERGEGAKGHFGMGFKTSCSTLGNYYEIFTRPIGKDVEYHVSFDIQDYSRRPAGADAWDIVIDEEAPSMESPLGNMAYGTAFVISQLKDKNITVSSVLSYLGEAFKGHLETGDMIRIIDANGEYEAIPKVYDFVPGSKIEINEVFGPNDKYKISGWMAIDSQTHNDGLYGFNIYRHNQLVEKWDKSWFRAHLMTSRIIGEVNMDFLDATFYKQGVQQSEDWILVAMHMKEFLKPLVAASNNLSKKGNINKASEVKRIISNLNQEYGVEVPDDNGGDAFLKKEKQQKKAGRDTSINDSIKAVVKEQSLILENEGEIEITYLEKESGANIRAPYDYIFSDEYDETEPSELQVIMFKDHPLWQKKSDGDVIKVLATYDAIYRMLVEKLNFETSEALKIRNEWISNRIVEKEK